MEFSLLKKVLGFNDEAFLNRRQLWIRTPGLGGNISVGMPLLEISSPPQDARKTTFFPRSGKLLSFVVH